MSSFGGLYVTRAGKIVQSKMAEGKILKFIKVAIGDGNVSGDLEKVTALSHKLEEYNITNIRQSVDGQAIFSFNFTNQGFLEGFYWRELGLFVEDPDTKSQILYAYGNAGTDAEYIPAYDSNDIISKKVDLALIFENTDNIVVKLDTSAMFVTSDELEQKISETLFKKHTITLNKTIAQNTNYELPATYKVGSDDLELYVEGVLLIKDINYVEVGDSGQTSNIIQFLDWNVNAGYTILEKVKGNSIRIYSEEEAIEAVEAVWIEDYGSLSGVSVTVTGYDVNNNYTISVNDSTTTAALKFYIVNRLTLEVTERG